MIRITVPIDPNLTSPNHRLHWGERARRNTRARELARLAWLAAGGPVAAGPVRVSVIIRRERALDPDNAVSCLKPLIDGIFREGVTPDDSARWIAHGAIVQERGKRWRGREEVEFVIEEEA